MLINSVHLRNFCQHVDRLIEFSPFMNVIVGANGCGKSTVLNAILFALTGINRLHGKNADNVSNFAAAGDDSYVEVHFAHRGQQFTVKRLLQPVEGVTLTVDGSQPIRGATKALERILGDLGTTVQRLEDYVFVEQKRIDGWFEKRPADRAKEMATLFGLDDAAAGFKALDKFAGRVRLPSIGTDIDKLMNEHSTESQFLQTLEQQLSAYADVPDNVGPYIEARNQLRMQYQRNLDATTQLQNIQTQRLALVDEVSRLVARQTDLGMEIAEYAAAMDGLQTAVQNANAAGSQWSTYRQSLEMQTLREATIGRLFGEWRARLPRPVKPVGYVPLIDRTAICADIATLKQSLNVVNVSLAALDKLAADKPCPTCGAIGPERAARAEALRLEREELNLKLKPLEAVQAAATNYESRYLAYYAQISQLKSQVQMAKRQRKAMKAMSRPAMAESQISEVLADFATLQSAHQTCRTELATNVSMQTRVSQQRTSLDSTEQQIQGQMGTPITLTAYEQAIAEQQVMQARYQEKKSLETHVASHKIRVDALLQRIADTQTVIEQQARSTAAMMKFEAAKAILHHSAAPRTVTRDRLGMLINDIDTALQLFEAPFRVTVDEELTFWARFHDGKRRQSDRRLSAGQRVILALSWRVALNTAFAGSLGMLALDEPTAGLDGHNLACVPKAFTRLRELTQTRGLQVLLVTHEERLIDSFDKVIQL